MGHDPQGYRLPVGYHDLPFIAPRARTRRRLYGERGNDVVTGNRTDGTVLYHCRCMDCQRFSQVGHDYFCSEYIGGTRVEWATGRRSCDPAPDAWHYCAVYDGPQLSQDVWLWPNTSCDVGPQADISPDTPNPTPGVINRDTGERGANRYFQRSYAGDRHGNSRAVSLSLLRLKNRPATRASDRR